MTKKAKTRDNFLIRLSKETYLELGKLGAKNDTYDDIVSNLIYNYKQATK